MPVPYVLEWDGDAGCLKRLKDSNLLSRVAGGRSSGGRNHNKEHNIYTTQTGDEDIYGESECIVRHRFHREKFGRHFLGLRTSPRGERSLPLSHAKSLWAFTLSQFTHVLNLIVLLKKR